VYFRSLLKEVAGRLRSRIAAHAISPGERLREWEVANDFGVPRLGGSAAGGAVAALRTTFGDDERHRDRQVEHLAGESRKLIDRVRGSGFSAQDMTVIEPCVGGFLPPI
jgi:hypothetical protein